MDDLDDKDRQLVDRVQRLERLAWKSLVVPRAIWDVFSHLERLSFVEERIRTLAYLEAMPAKL